MRVAFIAKTPEVVELNRQAIEEFETGLELDLSALLEKEEYEIHYEFYKNVNLFKDNNHGEIRRT